MNDVVVIIDSLGRRRARRPCECGRRLCPGPLTQHREWCSKALGPESFWRLVEKSDSCWIWRGGTVIHGGIRPRGRPLRYGQVKWDGKMRRAHRVAYELVIGPIPAGLALDHLCRNTLCVRPDHLEAVPTRVNTLRGTSPVARNAAKTYCEHGHQFDDRNTFIDHRGRRGCRTCRREQRRRYRAANLEDLRVAEKLSARVRRVAVSLSRTARRCPTCGAEPGAPCTSVATGLTYKRWTHDARIQAHATP